MIFTLHFNKLNLFSSLQHPVSGSKKTQESPPLENYLAEHAEACSVAKAGTPDCDMHVEAARGGRGDVDIQPSWRGLGEHLFSSQ